MAIYDNLPVYKQAYDLLLDLYSLSKNLSRDYRYTLGEETKRRLIDLMLCIYHANKSKNDEKLNHLKEAREYIVELKLFIRLLRDLKQIRVERLALANGKNRINIKTTYSMGKKY